MLHLTLNKFRSLPPTTRAMVYLFWVYEFAEVLVRIFMSVFVFMQTNSIIHVGLYNLIYFIGIFLGFCVWGYIASVLSVSMRLNYLRSFAIYILSFLVLIFLSHTFFYFSVFALINGTALGMFWVGVHSYEMIHIDDGARDFYSSMVSVGSKFFAVIGPLVATVSFYISEKMLRIETFSLLFIIIPFVYALSIPFLFKLPDYVPPKITKTEAKRLFKDPALKPARTFFIVGGVPWSTHQIIIPVIATYSLKTAINIGIWETVVGAASILAVILLAHMRHTGNRVTIFFWAALIYTFGLAFLFFWEASPILYIIYLLIGSFIQPIFRVSEHIIDLQAIELIKEHKDASFYSGLLYRDYVLALGRFVGLGCVLLFSLLLPETLALRLSIVFLGIAVMLQWWTGKRMLEKTKNHCT